MSIIVEGMDNTGKSTLCKDLALRFYLPIIDRQGRPDPVTLMQQINSFVLLDPPAIFDRHPLISEKVYSDVLHREDIFKQPLTWDFYVQRLYRDDPLIIHCRPSKERILDFIAKQMEGVVENADALVSRYDQLMQQLDRIGFTVIDYDFQNSQALERVHNRVYWYLKRRHEL